MLAETLMAVLNWDGAWGSWTLMTSHSSKVLRFLQLPPPGSLPAHTQETDVNYSSKPPIQRPLPRFYFGDKNLLDSTYVLTCTLIGGRGVMTSFLPEIHESMLFLPHHTPFPTNSRSLAIPQFSQSLASQHCFFLFTF